jgi:hypothetical protein
VLLAALGYLLLLYALSGSGKPLMQAKMLYPLGLVLFQWLSSAAVHTSLRQREILLTSLEGKRGSALAQAFRDSSLQAEIALRAMSMVKRIILFYQSSIFCLLIVMAVRGIPLASWVAWIAFLQAVWGTLGIGLINLFTENQFLLGEGITVPLRQEKRRALLLLSLLAVGSLLVLLAARETSLLPLSALLAFLDKLVRLFRMKSDPRWAQVLRAVIEERRRYYELLLSLQPPPSRPVSPLFVLIALLLRRLFVTLCVVALYLFLVAPLLSESFLQSLRERRLFAFLRRKLRAFARVCWQLPLALRRWWRSLDRRSRVLPTQRSPLAERHQSVRHKKRISLRKRAQMSRMLKAYLQLLNWGASHGVHYNPANTPYEYALRLEVALPGNMSTLTLVIEILEEVLFSPHLVAAERVNGYFRAIRLLRSRTPTAYSQTEAAR